jgi:hypothetical protein
MVWDIDMPSHKDPVKPPKQVNANTFPILGFVMITGRKPFQSGGFETEYNDKIIKQILVFYRA